MSAGMYAFHPLIATEAPQIWRDLQVAYAWCGGHLKYPTPASLLPDKRLWVCLLTPDVRVLAKPSRSGWKITAVCGGTSEVRLMHATAFVRALNAPPWFCEMTPAIAQVLGAQVLTEPAEIQARLPGKTIRFLRDGRYLRDVQGHTIEKVLGVRPPAG